MECVLHAANMKQLFAINILTQVCFLVQYQTRVSLMLNIWCFCKTFARPSTGDCQHQPCFLPEFPPRHQIISVGALSSFIWLAFKNLIKLDSKNNTTLDLHGIGLDMSDHSLPLEIISINCILACVVMWRMWLSFMIRCKFQLVSIIIAHSAACSINSPPPLCLPRVTE